MKRCINEQIHHEAVGESEHREVLVYQVQHCKTIKDLDTNTETTVVDYEDVLSVDQFLLKKAGLQAQIDRIDDVLADIADMKTKKLKTKEKKL